MNLTEYCNDLLRLADYPDYGPMGLQFDSGKEITRIAAAVSVDTAVIDSAARQGADLLIVHHGLFWNNESRTDAPWLERVNLLDKHGITLLAYHLALDAHPFFGNNILAAKKLRLISLHPWQEIGWAGNYYYPQKPWDILRRVHAEFGQMPHSFFYHPSGKIQKVAVIVGAAAQYVVQAKAAGFDTFFTGELTESSMHLAQDLEINLIGAGHDRTERGGVQELVKLISNKFHIPWTFIESPNPI